MEVSFRFVFSFSLVLVFECNVTHVFLVNNGLLLVTQYRGPISDLSGLGRGPGFDSQYRLTQCRWKLKFC